MGRADASQMIAVTACQGVQVPQLKYELLGPLLTEQDLAHGDGVLTEDCLQHLCETHDLSTVTRLELHVDSALQSIEPLGEYVSNLRQLRLTDSSIFSLRDLGTALMSLEVLWMSRCGLQDLGGADAALPALCEFYLPFNNVSDLSPLAGHENLEVLDIEGNDVSDPEEVAALRICPRLRELTLDGNPVCRAAQPGDSRNCLARHEILRLLPRLEVLDDAPAAISSSEQTPRRTRCPGRVAASASNAAAVDARGAPEAGELAEASGDILPPLEPSHPLLAKGLLESRGSAAQGPDRGEPDEDELIIERLKRPRPKQSPDSFAFHPHALTARPAVGAGSWFSLQPPDRRRGVDIGSSFHPLASARVSTSTETGASLSRNPCGFSVEGLPSTEESAASDLTCGPLLAGNPLTAVRQRRRGYQVAGTSAGESGMDIRELLRRHQAYVEPSFSAPATEFQESMVDT